MKDYLEIKLKQIKEINILDKERSHKLADELLLEILQYFCYNEFYGELDNNERMILQEIIHIFRTMGKWYS